MRSIGFLTENFAFMIDLYNIAKLFLGCKLGEDCTMAWHNKLGEYGEEKVNRYLLDMGYTVLERNWRVGHRELDFVCLDGEVLVVVEVKTRADDNVSLLDLLDYRKKRNLQAAGAAYLTKKNIHREIRFDLVVVTGAEMHLEYIKEVIDLFSLTALEICEGQQLDMEFESRNDVAEDEYIEMIRLKTAVLLAASLKIGAILAGASAVDAEHLYNFGMRIGVAFQLQDDLLDVYGDPEVFGKKIGGDILCNKKTYMLIKALERASGEQLEELNRWLNAENCQPAEKIAAVTGIYNQLTIRSVCENKMREYYTLAMESLEAVAVAEEKKKELKNLVKLLMYREM